MNVIIGGEQLHYIVSICITHSILKQYQKETVKHLLPSTTICIGYGAPLKCNLRFQCGQNAW